MGSQQNVVPLSPPANFVSCSRGLMGSQQNHVPLSSLANFAMVTRFVRWQLNKFIECTDKAHEMRQHELIRKVKEIHERLLQVSILLKIKERLESLMQELKESAHLILEEKNVVSELIGRHGANDFFGCEPVPFIKVYDPKVKALENTCRQNDKTLKHIETGLLLYFHPKDHLLTKVQNLLETSRKLSKIVSQSSSQFSRYDTRVKTEQKWLSEFPQALELCSGPFSIIMRKIMDLQKAVLEHSKTINDLGASIDHSHDFKSNFSNLHTLKRTLDVIERMSEASTAVKQEIADVSSRCKDLASIYEEKKIIALRFIRWERSVKENVSKLEDPLNKLHVEVNKAKKLYDKKFRRLPKDALVPEISLHVYKKAIGHSDFSWRTRKFNNRSIFPVIRNQGRGQCAYVSTISCTESLYKRSHAALSIVGGKTYQADEFKLKLSHEHLHDLVTSFCETNSRQGCNTLDYCLERMEAQGVVTEDIYDNAKENFDSSQRYRIKGFEKLNTKNSVEATAIIEEGTALIGNMKITTDYHRLEPNDIYDIPDDAVFEINIAGQTCSHCVVIIGFGVTPEGLAYYVFQNSYGPLWGGDGCGRVACTCLKHLYRAKV